MDRDERRERADTERREREEALRLEAERRRAESERLNRERRERIEATERERKDALAAARRDRERTLAKARASRESDAVPIPETALQPRAEPAPAAPVQRIESSTAVRTITAATSAGAAAILSRAVRASLLDRKVYEEIEADHNATVHAGIVVGVGALAAGVGAMFVRGAATIPAEVVAALTSWAGYAFAAYTVGTTVLRGKETKADWGELARTLGFASAPRVLAVFGPAFASFVWLWMLATTVVAIRAALDISTGRAIVVAIAAWITYGFVQAIATGVMLGLGRG